MISRKLGNTLCVGITRMVEQNKQWFPLQRFDTAELALKHNRANKRLKARLHHIAGELDGAFWMRSSIRAPWIRQKGWKSKGRPRASLLFLTYYFFSYILPAVDYRRLWMPYREEEYAEAYLKTHDKKYKDMAVEEMRDLIYSTIKSMNISGGISDQVLLAKGMAIALKAIDKWDKKKSKLSTYVVNQLQPLRRDVYKYAPILHIPENRIGGYSAYVKAYDEYVNKHGDTAVDPVIIADMAGLTKAQVMLFLKENNKIYNDSVLSTTDIHWKKDDYKSELQLIATEFENDPLKKRMWKHIVKALKDGTKINASILAQKVPAAYPVLNRKYNEMVETINKILLN